MYGASGKAKDPGASLLFHLEAEKYEKYVLFVLFLVSICLLLLLFNETLLHKVAQKVPESVILILVGIICAVIAVATGKLDVISGWVSAEIFFNSLLPPIILVSAYQLYSKQFLLNLDGILVLALVGTALNIFAIGGALYATYGLRHQSTFLEMLLLSSIISAVDPVAVLAVFNQIGRSSILLI